jgi:DNA-binding MarR family transcriptional regulator
MAKNKPLDASIKGLSARFRHGSCIDSFLMRLLKFSGRETAIIRAIDFATGTSGAEILVKTRIEPQEALDILNSLLDAGYIETNPPQQEHVERRAFYATHFEVNPAFVHQLKKSMVR